MASNQALAVPSRIALPKSDLAGPWATSACMLAADFLALSAVYWLAVIGRYLVSPGYHLSFYLQLFPSIGLFVGAFLIQGLYPGLLLHPAEELRRVFYCVTKVFLLIAFTTFVWRNPEAYSRSVFLVTWAAGAPVVLVARKLARRLFAHRSWWGVPAVVLGSGPAARRVIHSLTNGSLGLRVIGVLTDESVHVWDHNFPPILGGLDSAPEISAAGAAQYAILAIPDKSNLELRQIIQDYCTGFPHILLMPDLPGICSLGISAREIGGQVGLEVPQRLFHRSAGIVKRILDIALTLLALAALSPLFLVMAAVIQLTDPGSVFYGHKRYGRDGGIFKALKFRTMVKNGDEVLTAHFMSHPEQLLEWQRDQKLRDDPRVTAVGKWLRRYSLDELPQLWNVLMGEMSLVGPRPIVRDEIAKYGNGYGLYTRVLPGITGLWQVSGRNNTTYEARVAFDEYYVRNWSIWLDAYILARTVRTVLTAEGAY